MEETLQVLTLAHPVMPDPDGSHPVLAAMVAVSYVIQAVTIVLIVIHGFRKRSYGMPVFGVVAFLAISVICGWMAPLQPQLFRDVLSQPVLLWMWRGFALLMVVVFCQYFYYSRSLPTFWPEVARYRVVLSLLLFGAVLYGCWSFIVFYQDVYVNEIFPLVMMVVSVNYVTALFTRPKLRGLSVLVGVGWLVSNLLLYGATAMGNMDDPYPCHNGVCELVCGFGENAPTCTLPAACQLESCAIQIDTGYHFMYFLYSVTFGLNLAYVAGLIYRRQELGHGWDVEKTLRRMVPR
ncbi:MAG: hypothetical protein ACQGVC_03130 [Myxococcota bacterium]